MNRSRHNSRSICKKKKIIVIIITIIIINSLIELSVNLNEWFMCQINHYACENQWLEMNESFKWINHTKLQTKAKYK